MAGREGKTMQTLNLVTATQTFTLVRNRSKINMKTSKTLLKETKEKTATFAEDPFGAFRTAFRFPNIIINYK